MPVMPWNPFSVIERADVEATGGFFENVIVNWSETPFGIPDPFPDAESFSSFLYEQGVEPNEYMLRRVGSGNYYLDTAGNYMIGEAVSNPFVYIGEALIQTFQDYGNLPSNIIEGVRQSKLWEYKWMLIIAIAPLVIGYVLDQ